MQRNKILLKTLYENFASHFAWQWLIPPARESVLCSDHDEMVWIGYFHPKKAHLINVQESTVEPLVRKDEQLIILTEHTTAKPISYTGNIPVLGTREKGSTLINTLMPYLSENLSPFFTQHGVFLNIFGKGIFIRAPSGYGKSRLALKLLEKGHRLIADDAPLFRAQGLRIIGSSPPSLQNLLHIRELGIIDVTTLFGPFSVEKEKSLDLVIDLTNQKQDEVALISPMLKTQKWGHLDIPILSLPFANEHNSVNLLENAVKVAFHCLSAKNSQESLLIDATMVS